MLFFYFFFKSNKKNPQKYEAAQLFPTLMIQNIRMISKGSWDTEDCSNDAEKSALPSQEYIIF